MTNDQMPPFFASTRARHTLLYRALLFIVTSPPLFCFELGEKQVIRAVRVLRKTHVRLHKSIQMFRSNKRLPSFLGD